MLQMLSWKSIWCSLISTYATETIGYLKKFALMTLKCAAMIGLQCLCMIVTKYTRKKRGLTEYTQVSPLSWQSAYFRAKIQIRLTFLLYPLRGQMNKPILKVPYGQSLQTIWDNLFLCPFLCRLCWHLLICLAYKE